MDVRDYWKAVRKLAATFDPEAAAADVAELEAIDRVHLKRSEREVRLISVDNLDKGSVGGRVVLARPWLAAELITTGTHRLATAEEFAAYETGQDQKREGILREEAGRANRGTQVSVSPEALANAIAALGLKPEAQNG